MTGGNLSVVIDKSRHFMTKDILELDAHLQNHRDIRLWLAGRKRRKQLREAIFADWKERGRISTDRAMAQRVAAVTGFPLVSIIMLIAELITWWLQRQGEFNAIYKDARNLIREG